MTTFNDRAREILESIGARTDTDGEKYEQRRYKGVPPKALAALNKAHEEECLRVIGERPKELKDMLEDRDE